MRADGWPAWLLGGCAALLVALGVWSTGGPAAGRAERRDGVRIGDLMAIQGTIACGNAAGAGAPASLDDLGGADGGAAGGDAGGAGPAGCGAPPRRADPYTGVPYAYERTSERAYRVCAILERPDLLAPYAYEGEAFDPATGCREVTLPAPRA